MRLRSSDPPMHGLNKRLSEFGLVLLFLGYWIIVYQLEQVDIRQSTWPFTRAILPILDFLPYSGFFITLTEFLSWRVIRHIIPLIVGWYLARHAIIRMLQSFYDLADGQEAGALLRRLTAGRIGLIKPIPVHLDSFEEARKKDPLLKIGGPGRIVVFGGEALVTELNGRFHRVLGPGRHTLLRFETPRSLVDLRPQERELEKVDMVTSDGINISTSLSVTFQIDRGNEKPSRAVPFPYDEEAVRIAGYTETNQPDGNIGKWDSLPLLITAGQLRAIVAEEMLDDLIISDPGGVDIHRGIQRRMERKAKEILHNYGIIIRGSRLGAFELPEVVENQRKQFWEARWDSRRLSKLADGDAEVLENNEIARAEAEAIMLRAIAEGLQRSRQAGLSVSSRELVALRLIESLEAMARKTEQVMPLSNELIPRLDSLRQELRLTSGVREEMENQENEQG